MNSKSFYWRSKFIRHDIIILTNENKDFRNEYWKQGNRCYMVLIYPKSGMGHLPLNLKRLSEILRRLSVYYKMLVSVFNILYQFWLTVRPVLRNLGFYPRYKIGVVFFTLDHRWMTQTWPNARFWAGNLRAQVSSDLSTSCTHTWFPEI